MSQKEIKLKQNESLFKEGDISKNIYLIKSGSIRIFKEKKEANIEIDILRAGQIIGELSFFDHQPRSASAEALTDCTLIEISGAVFDEALSKTPDWLLILIKTITGRIRSANNKIRLLENATTDYEVDKYGNRSKEYFFVTHYELVRFCASLILVAARYGSNTSSEGIEFNKEKLELFSSQILQINNSKVIALIEIFKKIEILKGDLMLTDIRFLDQCVLFLNQQNQLEPEKKRTLTPRGFHILSLIMKNFAHGVKTGTDTMRIDIGNALKEENIPISFAQELEDEGFVKTVLLPDGKQIVVEFESKKIIFEYRVFWLLSELDKLNEQKRKA